jgi:putative spermidine/putrescine transport system ATP-binding protein
MIMSGWSVELSNVTKLYDRTVAVDGIALKVEAGQYCCLLGPSGCGKTSTLRMIAGHETVDGGDILVGSRRVNDLPPSKRGTAMMFQNYALFPHLTVLDNVAFALMIAGQSKSERIEASRRLLLMVGLSGWENRYPHQLSGGQQQRAALARALNSRPQVLLLDEPLSALDPVLRIQMRSELKRMQAELGLTFIHVTHSQEEAMALSDHMVVMEDGHVRQAGAPADVFERPASPFVADFIGGHALFHGTVNADRKIVLSNGSELTAVDINFRAGAIVVAAVRSDLIAFTPSADSDNGLQARVLTVEMLGPLVRVTLTAGDRQEFCMTVPERQFVADRARPRSEIRIFWPRSETKIYPQEQWLAPAA